MNTQPIEATNGSLDGEGAAAGRVHVAAEIEQGTQTRPVEHEPTHSR